MAWVKFVCGLLAVSDGGIEVCKDARVVVEEVIDDVQGAFSTSDQCFHDDFRWTMFGITSAR